MKRIFFIAFLLIAGIFPLPSEAFSQDHGDIQAVITEGAGIIVNDDFASGRSSAISDALQKAVKHVVATLIPQKIVINKSQVIKDCIYAKSDEYVHDYRIISEKHVQNVYSVNVKSTLFAGSIKDDLQTLGFFKGGMNKFPVGTAAITIRGLKSCTDYVKVRQLLQTKIVGVKNVYPRRFQWGVAWLALDIQGTFQSLAEEIAKTGRFSLKINRVDQNYMEVTFLR